MKRNVPIVIQAIVAIIMIIELFFNWPLMKTIGTDLKNWGIVISAFALALGSMNLIRLHGVRVMRKAEDWYDSVVLLIILAFFAITGIFFGGASTPVYSFFYQNIMAPCQVALQGMTIFFVASASYRALKIKNFEAGLVFFASVIVILASIPIGNLISPWIPEMSYWIMDIPNMAGQRGIIVTSAVGSIAMALRVFLGLERTHFGGE